MDMKRRNFLSFLGIAPVAAVVVAKEANANPPDRFVSVGMDDYYDRILRPMHTKWSQINEPTDWPPSQVNDAARKFIIMVNSQ
jgi:hypothetical protein